MKRAVLLLLLALGAAPPEATVPLRAVAVPLDCDNAGRTTVGRLRYMGGLALSAGDRRWGGLSGLRWDGSALVAVSDEGNLFRFVPVERGGRLVGVGAAQVVRLTGEDGLPLGGKGEADAEAVNLSGGAMQVSFERHHRVLEWRMERGMPVGPARRFRLQPDPAGLADNSGFEAFAANSWIVVALPERERYGAGQVPAQLRLPRMPAEAPLPIAVPLPQHYQPTDADMSRGEDAFILLSRHVSLTDGANARIDLVTMPPADGDGRVRMTPLATLSPPLTVDNLEGITLRQEGARTFLYLVSDDNFSPLQRTLLLKFEILGGGG